MLACMTLFKRAGKNGSHSPFSHRPQFTLFAPQILHNRCFQYPLGITIFPREIEDNDYKNLGGGKQAALWSSWKWCIGENKNHQEFSDQWWEGEIMFTCEIWQNRMSFLLNVFWAFLQYQKDRTFCLKSNQVKYTRRSACTKRMSQVTGH